MVDCDTAAVVDSAGLGAVELKLDSLPGIAQLKGPPYLEGSVQGEAQYVADPHCLYFALEAGYD